MLRDGGPFQESIAMKEQVVGFDHPALVMAAPVQASAIEPNSGESVCVDD